MLQTRCDTLDAHHPPPQPSPSPSPEDSLDLAVASPRRMDDVVEARLGSDVRVWTGMIASQAFGVIVAKPHLRATTHHNPDSLQSIPYSPPNQIVEVITDPPTRVHIAYLDLVTDRLHALSPRPGTYREPAGSRSLSTASPTVPARYHHPGGGCVPLSKPSRSAWNHKYRAMQFRPRNPVWLCPRSRCPGRALDRQTIPNGGALRTTIQGAGLLAKGNLRDPGLF